jgi:hypothetical protein
LAVTNSNADFPRTDSLCYQFKKKHSLSDTKELYDFQGIVESAISVLVGTEDVKFEEGESLYNKNSNNECDSSDKDFRDIA